jgi:hypothetical protein
MARSVHDTWGVAQRAKRKKRSRRDVCDENELWAEQVEAEQAIEIVGACVGERHATECGERWG